MAEKFEPTFESLRTYECPEWFRDVKFGIWSHWGPQSVPMCGDWYARNMYIQGTEQYEYHLLYIDVFRKGEKYFLDVQYYANAFDLDEWTYETEMSGQEGMEWRLFSCNSGGTYTKYTTDPETGKENKNVIYDDAGVTFILEDNILRWNGYTEDIYEVYYEEEFVKIEQ